ncbi:unnamed protein product [Orchesella dallaii]|uniref:Uncharacterized protein n=1 Tax=Orchesella dallaii TaxID=48710 RepID=A0ABP1S2C9_9HEXA
MLLFRSVFLVFIILSVSLHYSLVLSSFPADTVFHRLTCHKGFHLAAPQLLSKIEGALYRCLARYPNSEPDTYRDCLNFCMAQEIQMFSYSGNLIQFSKTNLVHALNEWFGGEDGPWIVKGIGNDFERCVKQYSHILSQDQSCMLNNGDLKSNQTVLWKCFQAVLPCQPEPPIGNGVDKNIYVSKFDLKKTVDLMQ